MSACTECQSTIGVIPLHGDKGGPPFCFMCAGVWHAKHSRKRKAGRIVIKAMKIYFAAGGRRTDFNKMGLVADGLILPGYDAVDTLGTDVGDITSELLADVLQLTHPDRHPVERKQIATRVTQELLALKPFVFPAPKPPPPLPAQRHASVKSSHETFDEAFREAMRKHGGYPCIDCANTVPYFYCADCRTEWDKRQREERERENAKQREQYARRKHRLALKRPPTKCKGCEKTLASGRRDTRHCSAACRQRAHRKRVTDSHGFLSNPSKTRHACSEAAQ